MLALFKRRNRKVQGLAQIDANAIPVLTAPALIDLLNLHNRLRQIKRLTAASDQHYEHYYHTAISAYLEAAQLQPASISDHHAGLGGLAVHTLEVVENALRRRKAFLLPQHADPELIRAEEQIWTYAVFAGALLHDAGKMVTLTRLDIGEIEEWSPHAPSLASLGVRQYRIRYVRAPYALQQTVNNTLFHLLPPTGRQWLSQNDRVMTQLTAYWFGNLYEMGVLGDIVRRADAESVAANRKAGGERDRLPHAPTIPLVERLMRALRQLIDDGEIKFNRSGGAGWVTKDGYCYLVCGVIASKVAERLRQEGSADIPTDNTRLFDIWQDHMYIQPTPAGQAVWHVRVVGDQYTHVLSMLKFESCRILHPSRQVAPFTGELVLCDTPASDTPPETTPAPVETSSPQVPEQVASPPDTDTPATPTKQPRKTKPQKLKGNSGEALHFLGWVQQGLNSGEMKVNAVDAKVHIIKEGVVLLSPAIFKSYLTHFGLCHASDTDAHYRKLQVRVQKLKKHLYTDTGKNVHRLKAVGENRESTLFGWVFPTNIFYDSDAVPEINKHIQLVTRITPKA